MFSSKSPKNIYKKKRKQNKTQTKASYSFLQDILFEISVKKCILRPT